MPKYEPNSRISDCWSSVGNVTFFHIDGVCYYKNKPQPTFTGTTAQTVNANLHKRALAAWRTLTSETQAQWNAYAKGVESHRPPFGQGAGISGQNLFVSAYHGFTTLGNEHIPTPAAFVPFPAFSVEYQGAALSGTDDLNLSLRANLEDCDSPTRYRLLTRLQLTSPDRGRNP